MYIRSCPLPLCLNLRLLLSLLTVSDLRLVGIMRLLCKMCQRQNVNLYDFPYHCKARHVVTFSRMFANCSFLAILFYLSYTHYHLHVSQVTRFWHAQNTHYEHNGCCDSKVQDQDLKLYCFDHTYFKAETGFRIWLCRDAILFCFRCIHCDVPAGFCCLAN